MEIINLEDGNQEAEDDKEFKNQESKSHGINVVTSEQNGDEQAEDKNMFDPGSPESK